VDECKPLDPGDQTLGNIFNLVSAANLAGAYTRPLLSLRLTVFVGHVG